MKKMIGFGLVVLTMSSNSYAATKKKDKSVPSNEVAHSTVAPKAEGLQIISDGRLMITLYPDGTASLNEGYNADVTARAFWLTVAKSNPLMDVYSRIATENAQLYNVDLALQQDNVRLRVENQKLNKVLDAILNKPAVPVVPAAVPAANTKK